jgi:hypothetical protein
MGSWAWSKYQFFYFLTRCEKVYLYTKFVIHKILFYVYHYKFEEYTIDQGMLERVDYYHKNERSPTSASGQGIDQFNRLFCKTEYYMDLFDYLRFFKGDAKINYQFGDNRADFQVPTIVKSRPIGEYNQNCVILKINAFRHYAIVKYIRYLDIPFEQKDNRVIWRGGAANLKQKLQLVQAHVGDSSFDLGFHAKPERMKGYERYLKGYLNIGKQLRSKFIISIEGIDVATNLKWIMASNSIALMPIPRFETWFMEGKLEPFVHYIPLEDDFSDLKDKYSWCLANLDRCREVIRNANTYVEQFMDRKRERCLNHLVLKKYLDHRGVD